MSDVFDIQQPSPSPSAISDLCPPSGTSPYRDQGKPEQQESETLRSQLWEQMLTNKKLERKVLWLEESLQTAKEVHALDVEVLSNEIRAKDETINSLNRQIEDMSHDMSALESRIAKCMDESTVRSQQAEIEEELRKVNVRTQILERSLEDKDTRIKELEKRELRGPVILKGELKMAKGDLQSAYQQIQQKNEQIRILKELLKIPMTNDGRESVLNGQGEAGCLEDLQAAKEGCSHFDDENGTIVRDDKQVVKHESEETLETVKSEIETLLPYYASEQKKLYGIPSERGKNLKVNYPLDYFNNPRNAPFLLKENKGKTWYRVRNNDGSERLEIVRHDLPSGSCKPEPKSNKRPLAALKIEETPFEPRKKPAWRTGSGMKPLSSNAPLVDLSTTNLKNKPPASTERRLLQHRLSIKPPTIPRVKVMWSGFRAEARTTGFNRYIKEKEEANQLTRLKEEEELAELERLEEKRLRRLSHFKARPMPNFRSRHPAKSAKERSTTCHPEDIKPGCDAGESHNVQL